VNFNFTGIGMEGLSKICMGDEKLDSFKEVSFNFGVRLKT